LAKLKLKNKIITVQHLEEPPLQGLLEQGLWSCHRSFWICILSSKKRLN